MSRNFRDAECEAEYHGRNVFCQVTLHSGDDEPLFPSNDAQNDSNFEGYIPRSHGQNVCDLQIGKKEDISSKMNRDAFEMKERRRFVATEKKKNIQMYFWNRPQDIQMAGKDIDQEHRRYIPQQRNAVRWFLLCKNI